MDAQTDKEPKGQATIMPVSVIILTFNEEDNIAQCLKALTWSDDIWIVDSNSTDETVSIAKATGAQVVSRPWSGFAEQRNFALDNLPLRHKWIFHLDADEFVTSELAAELRRIAAADRGNGDVTAFEVPFRMFFMGRWLRYGGTYPNYQVRFGRKDALRFTQVGHGQREKLIFGRLGQLKSCILHFNFSKGIGPWISKHIEYARDEAEQSLATPDQGAAFIQGLTFPTRLRRVLKRWSVVLPVRPIFRFLYMYVLRRGFMDGPAGVHYCMLVSIYEYLVSIQRRELRSGRDAFNERNLPK